MNELELGRRTRSIRIRNLDLLTYYLLDILLRNLGSLATLQQKLYDYKYRNLPRNLRRFLLRNLMIID